MKTIRRLYFYAVAFISIEVVIWGVIGLLRSIFDPKLITDNAQALAQAISLVLVGIPIFLFHWLWSQRATAREGEEKTASLRAVFLYGLLLATLIPAVQNLLALIDRTFLTTARLYAERAIIGGSQTWVDNVIAIVVNGLIAAYFWNVLKFEWTALPEKENFTEIRRLYRFVWVLYSLLMVIFGTQQALRYAFTLSLQVLGQIGQETAVNAIALLVVGTPIWFSAWRISQEAISDPAEKESTLRLGILYFLSLSGVITVLTAGGNLMDMVLNYLLGEKIAWNAFVQQIGGPISIGIPLGVVWAYYGLWLRQQIEFEELSPRRAGKKRLYFYILAAIGLTAFFTGTAMLLSLIIDLATGETLLGEYGYRERLAVSLATLAVSLPLWLMTWRPMQAEALAEGDSGDHARRSIVRKTYLYLALFAAVIGGMISAVGLVFTVINAALGGESISALGNSILNSLQLLILFIVLLLYHLSALRRDSATRADLLAAKQEQFAILVLDTADGKFSQSVKAAFAKHAPKVPLTIVNAHEIITMTVKPSTVVLPGSLAVNTPEPLEVWMRSFNGIKLIVPDEAKGVYWLHDFGGAALSARALAEGQEIRPQAARKSSAWTIAAYVFAALFGLQLLFILLTLVISALSSF
jgi:hypothetical protein